jgi:hypothetical protein
MEQPGLHILKGKPGSGKSTIIRSIEMVMGSDVTIKPTRRDGKPRGIAEVAGKSVRIMKTIREEGELQGVQSLGDLNIYDLHSPPHKTATTRDKHRIAALVTLTGTKVEPADFHYLLGKEAFESMVPSDALQTDDPIEMTARIKRAIEREALRLEALERTAQANALAESKAAEGFDVENPPDEEALQSALERAIRESSAAKEELSTLEGKGRAARLARKKADDARARLEEVGAGVTVAEATARLREEEEREDPELAAATIHREQSGEFLNDADAKVVELEKQLAYAKEKLDRARLDLAKAVELERAAERTVRARREAAAAALSAAEREAVLHSELTEAIDAGAVAKGPTDEELDAQTASVMNAETAVSAAKKDLGNAIAARKAVEAKKRADAYMAEANELAVQIRRLRGAAKDSPDVLTKAIQQLNDCPLKIRLTDEGDPRLAIATERSENEFFDERSDSQKWETVIRIAAGANKLIVLQQAAFGEFAPSTRKRIHELAQAHGCYIMTAQADDGELRGEMFAE